ncbi:MAG: hypothetical protein ACKV22_41765, partial [Bryobacteraceae bacterium]
MNCHAQVSVVRAGSFEVGPFLGASYGIDKFRVMGGGNLTYGINKWILPYVEYSYFPGIRRSESVAIPGTNRIGTRSYDVPLSDFHGGVHLRLPIRESPVVPYLVFGLGALINNSRTVSATLEDAAGVFTIPSFQVPGQSDFAVNTGGGFRFYMSQRFGFRVEAKAYKPTGT